MKTIILMFCFLFSINANAVEVSQKDKSAIKEVVKMLLHSLKNGDTEVAFSALTKKERDVYQTPGAFRQAIDDKAASLLAQETVIFADTDVTKDGQVLSAVILVDTSGTMWNIVFLMDFSSQWNVAGFYISKAKERSS